MPSMVELEFHPPTKNVEFLPHRSQLAYALLTDLSPIPCVGLSVLSVCPESVLWQIGWLDMDTVWGGEWGRSRDGCITWRPRAQAERGRRIRVFCPYWFEWRIMHVALQCGCSVPVAEWLDSSAVDTAVRTCWLIVIVMLVCCLRGE